MTDNELTKADLAVLIDIVAMKLDEDIGINEAIKQEGWTGTGVIGFEIQRLSEISAKLTKLAQA